MKILETKNAPGAIGPYSQGYVVNGFVYTSGQIPVDPVTGAIPEGIAAQADQSCKNVGAILEAAGLALKKSLKPPASWPTWVTSPLSTKFMQSTSSPSLPAAAWP